MYNFLILASTVIGCISISAFASLLGISIGITSSTIGLKKGTSGFKRYKSIIKRKKKKLDKMVLLAKSKLNSIDVLTSKALIDSNISHKFVLINNELKYYEDMKEEIKDLIVLWT